MLLNSSYWLHICFSNSWSHIDFSIPNSATFMFYTMTFPFSYCFTFLSSSSNKGLVTHRIRYIFYSSLSLNRPPRNHLTIIIMENTCCYNISATTNNTWVIMSYLFMSMLCFSSNNRKLMNSIFIFIHFFIISFIFSSFNRFYMWCTIATFIISIREFRLIKNLVF